MGIVHASTLWRWRTGKSIPRTQLKGKRRCGRRYKHEQDQWRQENLKVAAALIAKRRRGSHWVDYQAVAQQARTCLSDSETEKVLSKLKTMAGDEMPADLIATACCTALRLGPRIRRYRSRREHNLRPFWMAEQLKRKYPKLSDEEIHEALQQNPDYRWLRAALAEGHNERPSTVCVSKVFPSISRTMASYYRRSNPGRFALAVKELRAIAEIS
jgi:hypothetical protein